ncbi:hypothetical protein [Haloarcula onubensis]|uniref:CopG family transcriptional regulator n=1 Tax=Haloarcula onubensis TaxID=2950539 RepID=A0ABU2FSI1_9EURY|nr:hypothetical protein [Halomicroarcula sp. S3CR25-11]MDS0283369.1 hypothetical protein [Halomicroarcula sp. S3CR25-11]
MDPTERKYSVPDSVLEHLRAASETARDDEALYHIREAIQISESEIELSAETAAASE